MGDQQQISGKFNASATGHSTATINVSYHAAPPGQPGQAARAEAERLLEALPLDTIPTPAPLPSGSHCPPHANRQFVGRAEELTRLARVLREGGAAIIGQSPVVTGAGGIGKSQLAVECAWRYGQHFSGGVFWLSFADPAAIPAEIATCGNAMNLHADFAGLPLETQVAMVSSRWQDGLPRLLVFDNCEDPALFRDWCPRGGQCRVILTGRRTEWPADLGLLPLRLDTLSRAESIALLCKHRPDLPQDDPALNAIAEELGDFPLALHLAGSYLARYRKVADGKPTAYLAELRRPGLLAHASLTEGTCANGHEAHIARTFAASTARLDVADATDALALEAFAHAAHFATGEPIPLWLLGRALGLDWADSGNQRRLSDAVSRLADLGLVEFDDEGPRLHRLIAAFARDTAATPGTAREAVAKAVGAAASEQNKAGLPGPLLPWQGHLRHVADSAAAAGGELAALLLNELGYHLRMIADFNGARDAYLRALDIHEAALGPDHPEVAVLVNNLGRVLKDMGDLISARGAFQRALDIDEEAFGPAHPEVATDVNNLGSVLRALGDLDGSREAYQRALEIDKAAFGPNHPKIAIRVNNLGSILHDIGDLDGARNAFEIALQIDQAAFGRDHPKVAIDVNNLGSVLKAVGDLEGAGKAYRRAMDIDEATFGPNHPSVAIRVNNLGSVLHDLGDLDGAREAFQRALDIFERTFGPDHPTTRTVRDNLRGLS